MKKTTIALFAIILIIILWLFSVYNGLISLQESHKSAWAQVENQYQRRFDLIPNVVAAVEGAMDQEKEVFKSLADARSRYSGAQNQSDKVKAAGEVESTLSRLLVVMENYPTLKSIDAVQNLQVQLEGTENRVSVERQKYNEVVKEYNIKVKRAPGSIIAYLFNFEEKEYFEAVKDAQTAPKVDFRK